MNNREVRMGYMLDYLASQGRFKVDQFKALEVLDNALNTSVGKVSKGIVYKKMTERLSKTAEGI